ncbi:hypothetical protein H0H92_012857, partial [Tricholoma furcatifolium]
MAMKRKAMSKASGAQAGEAKSRSSKVQYLEAPVTSMLNDVGTGAHVYLAAVLGYLAGEILELPAMSSSPRALL